MILVFASIVAIVVMGFLVLRRGRDRRADSVKAARWLRAAGLVPLGLQTALFLFFGVGEMASGDPSGVAHLLPAAAIILLGMLAWLRPLEGGIALIGVGALFMVLFVVEVVASGPRPESAVISPSILITAAPQVVSGVLFLVAGILARRSAIPAAGRDE